MKIRNLILGIPLLTACTTVPEAPQWELSAQRPLILVGVDPGIFLDPGLKADLWEPLFGLERPFIPEKEITQQTGIKVEEIESVVLAMEPGSRPDRRISVVLSFRSTAKDWFERMKEAALINLKRIGNRELWAVGDTLFFPRGQDLWIVNLGDRKPQDLDEALGLWLSGKPAPRVPAGRIFMEFNPHQDLLAMLPATFRNIRSLGLTADLQGGLHTRLTLDLGDEKLAQGTAQVLEGLVRMGGGLQLIIQRLQENGDLKALRLEEFLGPALGLMNMKNEGQVTVQSGRVDLSSRMTPQQLTQYAQVLGPALRGVSLDRIFDRLLMLGEGLRVRDRPSSSEAPSQDYDLQGQMEELKEMQEYLDKDNSKTQGTPDAQEEDSGETGLKSADPESRRMLKGEKVRKP